MTTARACTAHPPLQSIIAIAKSFVFFCKRSDLLTDSVSTDVYMKACENLLSGSDVHHQRRILSGLLDAQPTTVISWLTLKTTPDEPEMSEYYLNWEADMPLSHAGSGKTSRPSSTGRPTRGKNQGLGSMPATLAKLVSALSQLFKAMDVTRPWDTYAREPTNPVDSALVRDAILATKRTFATAGPRARHHARVAGTRALARAPA